MVLPVGGRKPGIPDRTGFELNALFSGFDSFRDRMDPGIAGHAGQKPMAGVSGFVKWLDDFVVPAQFGDVDSDPTSCLQAAIDSGKPVFINRDFVLEDALTHDGDLTLFGPGRILHPHDKRALTVAPTWGTAHDILSFDTEIYPSGQGMTCAKLEVVEASSYSFGDVVLVYSDDALGAEAEASRGELRKVAGSDADYVWLVGPLEDTYTTNPKIRKHPLITVVIDGPTFSADGDPAAAETVRAPSVVLQGLGPASYVRASFVETWSWGLDIVSAWGGRYDVTGRNCHNDSNRNAYGYACVVSAASRGCVVSVRAANCRNAITGSTYPAHMGDAYYGAPRHIHVVDSWSLTGSSNGFSTHPGAYNWTFENCHVMYPNEGPETVHGNRFAFNISGANTTIINCSLEGVGSFLNDFSATINHGITSVTRIIGGYARIVDRTLGTNSGLKVLQGEDGPYKTDRSIHIKGFTSDNLRAVTTSHIPIIWEDCHIRNSQDWQVTEGTTQTIVNCVWHTDRNQGDNCIRLSNGATVNAHGFVVSGRPINLCAFYGRNSTGDGWALNAASISALHSSVNLRDDDESGSWTVTDIGRDIA